MIATTVSYVSFDKTIKFIFNHCEMKRLKELCLMTFTYVFQWDLLREN